MANIKKFDQLGRFGLINSIVASYILNEYLTEDSDHIAIDLNQMANTLDATIEDIRKACRALVKAKFLDLGGKLDWEDVASIVIAGISLETNAGQLALREDPEKATVKRSELGMDQFDYRGDILRCSVKPQLLDDAHTGWYLLSIAWNPDTAEQTDIATNAEYDSESAAWDYWDNYIQPLKEELSDPDKTTAQHDPIFRVAIRSVAKLKTANSVDLQKTLTISSTRAEAIFAALVEYGVVEQPESEGKKSKVLLDTEKAEALLVELGLEEEAA